MTQPYPQSGPPQGPSWGPPPPPPKPSRGKKGCGIAAIAVGAVIVLGAVIAGVSGSKKHDTAPATDSKSPAASTTASKAAPKPKSDVQSFKDYVHAHGTKQEIAAARHVTKIQGADTINNALDTADVYTDYTGDFTDMNAIGNAKLIASSFRDWEASRGKESKNGLVTIYSSTGDLMANGNY